LQPQKSGAPAKNPGGIQNRRLQKPVSSDRRRLTFNKSMAALGKGSSLEGLFAVFPVVCD
jgi:hypothetical protein